MVVIALFAFLGCDKPARVDIGDLVEALQSLDHEVAVDADGSADEILADEDLDVADQTDVSGDGDELVPDDDGLVDCFEEGYQICQGDKVMTCMDGKYSMTYDCDCAGESNCWCEDNGSGSAACTHLDPGPDDADVQPDDGVVVDGDELLVEEDLSDEDLLSESDVVTDDSDEPVNPDCCVEPDDDVVVPRNVICSGQTKCYDNTVEIACPTEENDFYGQDAQYAALGYCVPRDYTVSGTSGSDIVTDNNTGLIWQRTLPATYAGCTGGTPAGTTCAWQEAVDYCDALNYGEHDDWRLPSRKELASLPDFGSADPAIDVSRFLGTIPERHWTASSYVYENEQAWIVSFAGGYSDQKDKTEKHYLRCVTGYLLVSDNVFVEVTLEGKIIVTDTTTGLMWTKEYSGSVGWSVALDYCVNLTYGGYADWRLPNINELRTLVDDTLFGPASNFPETPTPFSPFWSSSSNIDSIPGAWYVDFHTGYSSVYGKGSNQPYARCVR